MLKVEMMTQEEMSALLLRVGFGHMGCTRDNHPYVVPMHYVYDSENLFFLTTEGTKTEFISANSEVCFQVEEVVDAAHWQSVMVVGHAKRVEKLQELERAIRLITERNPNLTPAINKTDIGAWHRQNKVVTYRIRPEAIYGRKTV
ncbi:MAG: pyridoxamine 5'-phosphate oxidase family protein [Pyrinomonadaceae bacterium]